MRILLITDVLPYPPISGAPVRNYQLMRRISAAHQVWVISFVEAPPSPDDMDALQAIFRGVELVPKPQNRALAHPLQALEYLRAGIPPDLRLLESREMVDRIGDLLARIPFDIVQIENSYMAFYLDALPQHLRARATITFHDVVFTKYARIWRLEPKLSRRLRLWLHSRMMRRWEPNCGVEAGRCLMMSEIDRQLLLAENPRLQVTVIPNGVDTRAYKALPHRAGGPSLLFVGNMVYRPNIDAMLYFCANIFPLIKRQVPKVELWIVGLNPPEEIRQLSSDRIHVTGQVSELKPYYQASQVCIVPLRAGSGTRLKILEAMAFGRPVVSTSVGCEGLDVRDGVHLFVADSAELFAQRTIELLTNPVLRDSFASRSRALVRERYDWDVIVQALLQVYDELAYQGAAAEVSA
jgi:sugar transferase (PEP-CTERM/EpsH1 system associated)